MGFTKKIKNCIGFIYVSIFSFALSIGMLSFGKDGIETRAGFDGTFTISNSSELEYSPSGSYRVNEIRMTELTNTGSDNYDLGIEIYGMDLTGGSAVKQEEGYLSFTGASYIPEQGTGEYGNYYGRLTGYCDDIYSGQQEVDFRVYVEPSSSQPTGDGTWTFTEGNLFYDSNEYESNSALQTAVVDNNNGTAVAYYDIYGRSFGSSAGYTLMEQLTLTLTSVTIIDNPDPEEEIYGAIECYCGEVGETITLSVSYISNGTSSWSYNAGYLSYSAATYYVQDTIQQTIEQEEENAFLVKYTTYMRDGSGSPTPRETLSVHFTDAEYEPTPGSNYYGMISGYCDVITNPEYITIYADVEPNFLIYDGWNYTNGELFFYDTTNSYKYILGSGAFSLYNHTADLVYAYEQMGLTETAHLTEATFNGTVVSGYLSINGVPTWVSVDRGDVRIVESYVQGWNFSYDWAAFGYYDYAENEFYCGEIDSGSIFYDFATNIAYLTYTVTIDPDSSPQVLEESFELSNASYDYTYVTGDWECNGAFAAVEIQTYNTQIERTGWIHNEDTSYIEYYEDSSILNPKIEEVIFNNYNNENYDEIRITYAAYMNDDYDDESAFVRRGTLVLSEASVITDPEDNQGEGLVHGTYFNGTVDVFVSRIDIVNNVSVGFNYLYGLEELIYYENNLQYIIAYNSALINEDEGIATISYSLYSGENLYKSSTFDLESPYVEESNNSIQGYFDRVSTVVTIVVSTIEYVEVVAHWKYVDRMLIWRDPEYDRQDIYIESVIKKVTYFTENNTIEILYGIYALNPDVIEDETGEPSEGYAFLFYKTVHFSEVEILREPNEEEEIEGLISGVCSECPQAEELLIPSLRKQSPEEPTPDSKVSEDIVSILSDVEADEQTVQTINEHIDNVPTDTGKDIVATIEKTLEVVTTTEEKEIVATVMKASVVVSANKADNVASAAKIDSVMPKQGLDKPLESTIEKFIQDQLDYLLGKETIVKNSNGSRTREVTRRDQIVDLSISKEEYDKAIDFVEVSIEHMKGAALQIRKCSGARMKMVVNDYISSVTEKSFIKFDETKANDDFVNAVYQAIMRNMQQQVIDALKREHKPSSNYEKELLYKQQLEACEDDESFEQIVIEVLRQKYVSITKEEIAVEDFEKIYHKIFRSWALDDPTLNEYNITLEELTTATIETTTRRATKMTYNEALTKKEYMFLIILGSVSVVGLACAITIPTVLKKRKIKEAVK